MSQEKLLSHNPDVLSCIANLSSDEVFTSPEIANAMLDMLPQDLFKSTKTTFLDPACKSGIFLREIAKRLIKGLEDEIPVLEERLEHIFKNQIFGLAVTELTSLLSRRSLYCSKFPNQKYSICPFEDSQGNIRYTRIQHKYVNGKCVECGASQREYDRGDDYETYAYEFIHKVPSSLPNIKFNVIISNPPYSLTNGSGGAGKGTDTVYHLFMQKAISMNPDYIAMITPARWFNGGKGLDDFRLLMLKDNHISTIVDYADSKTCFPSGVDIPGGICYYLWDKNHAGDCEITNVLSDGKKLTERRRLDEYDTLIRSNLAVGIVKKVLAKKEPLMKDYVLSRKPFGIDSNVKFDEDGDLLFRSSSGTGKIRSNRVTEGLEIIGEWKTIMSKVTTEHGGVPDRDGKMKVLAVVQNLPPQSVCSESYLVVGHFQTEEEANNLSGYLKTKFVRFLLMQMLASMNMTKGTFAFVPQQDFSIAYTDMELYKKYDLTPAEIDVIEKTIKPMN